MSTPTDAQVREYADKLPAIYRDVLAAFPEAVPDRRAQDGLSADSVFETVERKSNSYRWDDLTEALDRLAAGGFITTGKHQGFGFFTPTPLGERLITAITGHKPAPAGIPELPAPTWGM